MCLAHDPPPITVNHITAPKGIPSDSDFTLRALVHALDAGITFFDTAVLDGFGSNEELLGRAIARIQMPLQVELRDAVIQEIRLLPDHSARTSYPG
jgi:diketogulonate reductase-like aldo/keto reductase